MNSASNAQSAAAHTSPHLVLAKPTDTAEAVRQQLLQQGRSEWELLCVIGDDGCLLGTLTAAALLVLLNDAVLGGAVRPHPPLVAADTDQEKMASIALHHHVAAMPVVDDAGHLVGVVASTTLMHILRREHVEDLHRLAGITRESADARNALEEAPLRRARHRLPWLVVGLGGSMVATFIVARFESALTAKPELAFFVPGLVYLADAIGTQSEAVAVRVLSLSQAGRVQPVLQHEWLNDCAGLGLVGVARQRLQRRAVAHGRVERRLGPAALQQPQLIRRHPRADGFACLDGQLLLSPHRTTRKRSRSGAVRRIGERQSRRPPRHADRRFVDNGLAHRRRRCKA
jgi:CBS domain-containing protein